MKAVGQSAAWVSTLIVARLLSPSDYGVYGMATLYLGLLQTLSEFGIGSAIVAQQEVNPDDAAQLNTVAVTIGAAGALVLCATAPLVAWFFRSPRLVPVLIAMSLMFVIASFRTVPWALLQRDLKFKRLAVYDATQAVVLAGGSIALAAAGARYWTLVAASLLSAALSAAITLYRHPTSFARPDFRRVKATLTLGGDVMVQRLCWYGYSNADFVVAGRVLGERAMGAYSLAWSLANVAIDKIGATLLQVTPGVLARARDDEEELRRYVLGISELLVLVISPITVGVAVEAPVLVHAVLGFRWEGMIPALQILSLYATVRAAMPFFSQLLLVQGDQRYATRLNVALVLIMPPAFLLGSRWGITGIACGWILVYPLVALTLVRRSLHSVRLRARTFVRVAVWPAVMANALMAGGVLGVRWLVPDQWPALVALPIEIVSGATIYCVVLLTVHGARMRELIMHVRTLRSGATHGAA
jgi:PST family polysaccharide transporter